MNVQQGYSINDRFYKAQEAGKFKPKVKFHDKV